MENYRAGRVTRAGHVLGPASPVLSYDRRRGPLCGLVSVDAYVYQGYRSRGHECDQNRVSEHTDRGREHEHDQHGVIGNADRGREHEHDRNRVAGRTERRFAERHHRGSLLAHIDVRGDEAIAPEPGQNGLRR